MTGNVRHPRSIVAVNGGKMDFLSWEVNSNGYYAADTFTAKFPLYLNHAGWWSKQTSLDVDIYDGYPSNPDKFSIANLTHRILGRVDSVELDPIEKVVHVTGRDYTSKLIDTKVLPPDPNMTSSDFAIKMAALYGFDIGDSKYQDVKTGELGKGTIQRTFIKIGTYYGTDHVSTKVEKSAWDILTYLAKQEQFIVYVSGKRLFFHAAPSPDKPRVLTLDNSTNIPNAPTPRLNFIRNLTLSRGIIVYVRYWNYKRPKGGVAVARVHRTGDRILKKNQPVTGEEQVYTYNAGNVSAAKAQALAQAYLASISQHEVRFTADDMPGDATLDPFQPVKWKYNGTMFEQVYFLESVVRSFSFDGGYFMSLRGKNHSVESSVTA